MDGVVRQSMRHSRSARSAGSKCTGVMRFDRLRGSTRAGVLGGCVRVLRVGCHHGKRARDGPGWWGGWSDMLVGADQRAGGVCGTVCVLEETILPLAPLLFEGFLCRVWV